jgi:hypothetical protein
LLKKVKEENEKQNRLDEIEEKRIDRREENIETKKVGLLPTPPFLSPKRMMLLDDSKNVLHAEDQELFSISLD